MLENIKFSRRFEFLHYPCNPNPNADDIFMIILVTRKKTWPINRTLKLR